MKFRTEVSPEKQTSIDYSGKSVFIGSCFSQHIHNQMKSVKLDVINNPFGIVYNPISVAQQLTEVVELKPYSHSDLDHTNERWFSFQHHSDFSFTNADECLNTINSSIEKSHQYLKSASHLFITLGTSWAYSLKEGNIPVSNCHKMDSKKFTKEIIDFKQMSIAFSTAIKRVKNLNPNIQIIFSISPVRHLSDGFFENQLSKGRLFELVHFCRQNFDNVSYFNAYELVLDDLRDYRFFTEDMIHPSEQAISYVWEKFIETFFTDHTKKQVLHIKKLTQAANHKPFNPASKAHLQFVSKTVQQMEQLESELSISFTSELNKLKRYR
jgi:hypothetical protein